jgi:iduronate 2-sulfatase
MKTASLLFASLSLLGSSLTAAPAPSSKSNVLLILVDDLKPLTRSYGDPIVQTPQLDRLSARGVQFNRAYCNQSVCGPSRYNLMLGARSTSLGVYAFGRDFRTAFPGAVTLPQHFQRHGYTTQSIGKVFHVGHGMYDDDASWSVPAIHDKVVEYVLPASTAGGQLTREEAYFGNIKSSKELPRGAAWEKPDVADNAYADGRVADQAITRLAALKQAGTPFFLAVGFARPHLPFSVPKKYWDLYDRAQLPLAANPQPPQGAPAYAMKGLLELNQYDSIPAEGTLDEDLQRSLIHGYYASVSYVDAQIGRVLDSLTQSGLATNTIVVLWGDNGFSFGTHGDWTKHTTYEESNRIPIVIAGPGVKSGPPTEALIETVDLYPTLAALAGLPAPTGPQPIDGLSQLPVLQDPAHARVKDHVYHVAPRPRRELKDGEWLGRAIRTERYRYVKWLPFKPTSAAPGVELYDYVTDPHEKVNVAAQHPEIVAQLQTLLDREPTPRAPLKPSNRTR